MLVSRAHRTQLVSGTMLAVALVGAALACSGDKSRPPPFPVDAGSQGGAGPGPVGGGDLDVEPDCEGPPSPDTTVLCGEQLVPVVVQKPTLYFVMDVSGSMTEPLLLGDSAATVTKLEASQAALLSLTLEHGHRIHYGLATFPGPDGADAGLTGCGAGQQTFAVRAGDPLLCLNRPGGDAHEAFSTAVGKLEARGGTPLSSTLVALSDTILDLPRPASIVLLTDGAPNCNEDARCSAADCIPNLEGGALPSGYCDDSFNCCDSEEVLESDLPFIGVPEAMCVDRDASLAAIEAFAAEGIRTFVVGVPGSDAYRALMNSFAEAGDTARDEEVAYFDVRAVDELSDSLAAIGAETSQGCQVDLERAAANPELLNVYFDAELVPMDAELGWTVDGAEVTFHGAACDQIEAGLVTQMHLISGCPSVVVR
jgi:hypothetical protein